MIDYNDAINKIQISTNILYIFLPMMMQIEILMCKTIYISLYIASTINRKDLTQECIVYIHPQHRNNHESSRLMDMRDNHSISMIGENHTL